MRTRNGCAFIELDGDLVLEASEIRFDRGAVRCTLSLRRGEEVLFRDQANLTGHRAREQAAQRLKAAVPEVAVDEAALLALEVMIRKGPPQAEADPEPKPGPPALAVRSYEELLAVVTGWLEWTDADALVIILGAVAGHRLGGEPPWLLVVGPPGSAKTELLRMLWGLEDVYPLSTLTARTLASGLEKETEPSLLASLHDKILVVKDLTTVLEMRTEERQEILAQLREVHDGRFDAAWGTGKTFSWRGRLGFIAGVTPAIDHYHGAVALLGPRFLYLRLITPDRQGAAERAMENVGLEEAMREELKAACAGFFAYLPQTPPEAAPGVRPWLAQAADLVARARSPVRRDREERELREAPEPELPTRLARQLYTLLLGATLAAGRGRVAREDLTRIARVALDCIPALRRKVLEALEADGDWVTTTEMANRVQQATTTVRRTLEDLQALGLVVCDKGGRADRWVLSEAARGLFAVLRNPPQE